MSSPLNFVFLLSVFVHFSLVHAYGADPLQDFCVADLNSKVYVNGFICKDPSTVQANDFFFDGLVKAGNTNNALGSAITSAFVTDFPGIYTLGISMARLDFAPGGLNQPHSHPRASEILVVIEGTLLVGFVSSNPENKYFSKELQKGEIFVFPQGTIHFQQNLGIHSATAIVALSSSGPGRSDAPQVTFGSSPRIPDYILARTFDIDKSIVHEIRPKVLALKEQMSIQR